jgi:hypothetical protein
VIIYIASLICKVTLIAPGITHIFVDLEILNFCTADEQRRSKLFTNHEPDGEMCDSEVRETLYFLYSETEPHMSTLVGGKVTQTMYERMGIIMRTFWKLLIFSENAHGTMV